MPSAVKLVVVVGLVSVLYTALVIMGNGRGRTRTADGPRAGDSENLRRTFRKLSMMGYEEGDGQGGEWRTCRSYQEDKLGPHKKVCRYSACDRTWLL